MNTLQPLVARLKACPAQASTLSREVFIARWDELCREDVTPFSNPTIPVLAALILTDERFAALLNEPDRAQLRSLVRLALDRYEQQTNPPNKLGKLLADIIQKA